MLFVLNSIKDFRRPKPTAYKWLAEQDIDLLVTFEVFLKVAGHQVTLSSHKMKDFKNQTVPI